MKAFELHSTKFDGSLHYHFPTLIVRSSNEELITYTPAGGPPVDGTGFIELAFAQGVPWLAVGSCNPGRCVSAQLARICDSDCTASVTLSVRLRED